MIKQTNFLFGIPDNWQHYIKQIYDSTYNDKKVSWNLKLQSKDIATVTDIQTRKEYCIVLDDKREKVISLWRVNKAGWYNVLKSQFKLKYGQTYVDKEERYEQEIKN